MQYLDTSQPEVEDAAVILARRRREEEEGIRLKLLLQDDHPMLKSFQVSAEEEQCALKDILKSADSDLHSRHELGCVPPGERVLGISSVRYFTADSLSLDQFVGAEGRAATCCQRHLCNLNFKDTVRIRSIANAVLYHDCAFSRGFLRYLFFLTSVSEDRTVLECCSRELFVCHKGLLTASDFLTVLLNWGIKPCLLGFDFQLSHEFQQGAELGTAALQLGADDPMGSKVGMYTPPNAVVSVILGLVQNIIPVETPPHFLCGLLKVLFALLADRAAYCSELQAALVYLLELVHVQKWSSSDLCNLVRALNLQEINPQDRLDGAKCLFCRYGPNHNQISAAVAFAILQQIHGVPASEVLYVPELNASQLLVLLPKLSYSNLSATELYVSLDALMTASAGVVIPGGNDGNFYSSLCQHLEHVKCEMGRLPELDNQFIRILIQSMSLVWKVKAGSQNFDLPQYVTDPV